MPTSEAIYSTTTGLFSITKFRNFREKPFSPKMDLMDINRFGTIWEVQ
ncbi:hypothetical protein T10_12479 [Trichinella papuae]|uniref:Uncharacterized protein n=1 Tax=Trichinella papuae TaxID=268474 RepID=A0A0V1LYY6_9BILA|nr:hypothetical protein T10_12479 [Trichinella papuae]